MGFGEGEEKLFFRKDSPPLPQSFPLNFRNNRNHNRIAAYDLAEEAPHGRTNAIAKAGNTEPWGRFKMVEDKALGILSSG